MNKEWNNNYSIPTVLTLCWCTSSRPSDTGFWLPFFCGSEVCVVLPFVVMMLFGCAVAAAAAAFLPRRQFVAAVFGGCGARSVRRPSSVPWG